MSGVPESGRGPRVYIGLLHHPVLNKDGLIVNTAVTNLDLHDLARLAATYDLAGYYVIQPLELQKRLVRKLMSYWSDGRGGAYNQTRQQAFDRVRLTDTLEQAVAAIEAEAGTKPLVVGTSARPQPNMVSYGALRREMEQGGLWLVLFGTGWGVEPEFLERTADRMLEPIPGRGGYNHLSVRMAAAIIIDRLLAPGPR